MTLFRSLLAYLYLAAVLGSRADVKNSENVEYLGRFDFSTGSARAAWPGTGIKVNLLSEKDTVDVTLNYNNCEGSCNYFIEVEVNCAFYKKYEISPTSTSISLSLASAPHNTLEVSFVKVTESSNGNAQGVMEIGDLSVIGASFVKPGEFLQSYKSACPRPLRMLVIGDSITAAYGVEGAMECTFSASTENSNQGWASIVAKTVGAHVHLLPWSGRGVVRNYADPQQMSEVPMPSYYNRTLATEPIGADNYWDPAQYQPHVVLVLLGTNDYSVDPQPTDEQFQGGLVDLLHRIQVDYPKAQVASMCAPMRRDPQCANIAAGVAQVPGVQYVDIPTSTLDGGLGCDWHPNAASQQMIADAVLGHVQKMLSKAML